MSTLQTMELLTFLLALLVYLPTFTTTDIISRFLCNCASSTGVYQDYAFLPPSVLAIHLSKFRRQDPRGVQKKVVLLLRGARATRTHR